MNESWQPDTATTHYAVIGDPIRHSRSPLMLNRAFRETEINAVYTAFHVRPGELAEAVRAFRALRFGGVNVTIPHKVAVMAHLDDIDDGARVIGAVNTIVNRDGRLIGYNTDGIGYVRSLREEAGFDPRGRTVAVVGAGGAARGVAYALGQAGAARLLIANRTAEKARDLARDLSGAADCQGMGLPDLADANGVDLVVNTTDVGMSPNVAAMPVDPGWFREDTLISDIVYNPLETRLLAEAARRGMPTHSGLGMFIYQGAYAFEYWTGRPAPAEAMRRVVLESLSA